MKTKTKQGRSRFKRIIEFLHLWLGLITGVVVFVVCITAGIWVFRDEIAYVTMPENRVEKQQQAYLKPSELIQKATAYRLLHKEGAAIFTTELVTYRKPGFAAVLEYKLSTDQYGFMLMNPYSGAVNFESNGDTRTDKFFLFLRAGHRFFWLPRNIGSPFVGTSCLLFLVILITGIIWWYPKKWNASTRKKSFSIKWNAKWKRLNIDLHNVLGFYAFLIAIILTITGITFTFSWFDKGFHKVLTGNVAEEEKDPQSNISLAKATNDTIAADKLWQQYATFIAKGNDVVTLLYPGDSLDTWSAIVIPTQGRIADLQRYYHDQYSLELIRKSSNYDSLPAGEKLYNMTFDIHVATIFGLPSKILASLTCLICASLPVTGFIIWYNRKFGRKKKSKQLPSQSNNVETAV